MNNFVVPVTSERSFSRLRHAAVDALLTGGAFTRDFKRLQCFTDEVGDAPKKLQYDHAASYIGSFLTHSGCYNIHSVHVQPKSQKVLTITINRIVNGKLVAKTWRYTYKRRLLEAVENEPIRMFNPHDNVEVA